MKMKIDLTNQQKRVSTRLYANYYDRKREDKEKISKVNKEHCVVVKNSNWKSYMRKWYILQKRFCL